MRQLGLGAVVRQAAGAATIEEDGNKDATSAGHQKSLLRRVENQGSV